MQKLNIHSDEGPVERAIIEAFADEIGVTFPENYIELLSQHDHLYPIENIFDFINYYGENDERDVSFYGYKQVNYGSIYSFSCIDDECSYGKDIIAFGGCANGDYVCFDYRHTKINPPIVVMFHDDFYTDEDGEDRMVLNHVANSFDEFIDMLYRYEDEN